MTTLRSTPQSRIRLSILAALTAAGLSACYVVPIDPHTGQGYPIGNARDMQSNASSPGNVPVINPPAPPALPQPSVMSVRLYPLNVQANKGGLLTATVIDNNAGHGIFAVAYLGDNLQGESTRVDANYASFGRIYNEVLGYTQRNFNGRRGIANAYGGKGVNAQCEYLVTGPSLGTGACLFSDGAKYQMYFGG